MCTTAACFFINISEWRVDFLKFFQGLLPKFKFCISESQHEDIVSCNVTYPLETTDSGNELIPVGVSSVIQNMPELEQNVRETDNPL
jgi:hypothetical protein